MRLCTGFGDWRDYAPMYAAQIEGMRNSSHYQREWLPPNTRLQRTPLRAVRDRAFFNVSFCIQQYAILLKTDFQSTRSEEA